MCRHADIRNCPLYHAMHIPGAPSCRSPRLEEGLCAVDLGADYNALLLALTIEHPREVAECEWHAAQRAEAERRERNGRQYAVH